MERKRITERLREQQDALRSEWRVMPMMPLRGVILFPNVITSLDVGRNRSINAVEQAMKNDENLIFLVMQKEAQTDEPTCADLYEVGTVAKIRQMLKLPGGTVRLMVEGLYRARITGCLQEAPFFMGELLPLMEDPGDEPKELMATSRILKDCFDEYVKESRNISPEVQLAINSVTAPNQVADLIAGNIPAPPEEKQELLETLNVSLRLESLIRMLLDETEIIRLEQEISQRVRQQMDKSQRDYYLREQIKAIQVELGEDEDRTSEIRIYREKAEAADLPDYVMERVEAELKKLAKTPPMVAEGLVITNYLDTLLALPWNKEGEVNTDIHEAERILDEDHYGLEKPKERILEYLAACQLKQNLHGPILCLIGPPGVGKTSLGKSIARATGRKFVRMSLGGVRDEAEIRGHRRTYIGAMTGRILSEMKQAGTSNPLFLLDEVDKMASDWKGDPTSALLEALDPEQNDTFVDHYLEIPFDLSKVMFVTTANDRSSIPQPLQDRMEMIELTSYTEDEKVAICKKHLLPKQIKEHGLEQAGLKVTVPALRQIIRGYTREAGVRELERRIAKVCRKTGRDVVGGAEGPFRINNMEDIQHYLGVPRYLDDKIKKTAKLGVATGLAWTQVGGELLQIEVISFPGKGKFTVTGQLGDVMKESVQAAYTYIRSRAKDFKVPADVDEKVDVHIHFPEGAVPKDGPSAGITIATALASQFSGRKVRGDIAMTGEITLHGMVLPVGGIKEKLLAAWRNNIKEIIMPKECGKDLEELPADIREKMTIHLVETAAEAIDLALEK